MIKFARLEVVHHREMVFGFPIKHREDQIQALINATMAIGHPGKLPPLPPRETHVAQVAVANSLSKFQNLVDGPGPPILIFI